MDLSGRQTVEAPRTEVWESACNPAVLKECIPGVQDIHHPSGTEFVATVDRSLASITVAMKMEIDIIANDQPDEMTIHIEGTDDRTSSDVTGTGIVHIESDNDGGSIVEYDFNLRFTGRLVRVSSRLLKRQVKTDLDTTFTELNERVT